MQSDSNESNETLSFGDILHDAWRFITDEFPTMYTDSPQEDEAETARIKELHTSISNTLELFLKKTTVAHDTIQASSTEFFEAIIELGEDVKADFIKNYQEFRKIVEPNSTQNLQHKVDQLNEQAQKQNVALSEMKEDFTEMNNHLGALSAKQTNRPTPKFFIVLTPILTFITGIIMVAAKIEKFQSEKNLENKYAVIYYAIVPFISLITIVGTLCSKRIERLEWADCCTFPRSRRSDKTGRIPLLAEPAGGSQTYGSSAS